MNTRILPVIAFLAALAAFVLLPVGAVAASTTLAVTGMLAIFLADYGRTIEPVRVSGEIIAFGTHGGRGGMRDAA